MANINLLPEDLREQERKELDALRQKPREDRIAMTNPAGSDQPKPLTTPQPSVMSRLFARTKKDPEPILDTPTPYSPFSETNKPRPTVKVVDIPTPPPTQTTPKPEKSVDVFNSFALPPKQIKEPAAPKESADNGVVSPVVFKAEEKILPVKVQRKFNWFGWLGGLFGSNRSGKKAPAVKKEKQDVKASFDDKAGRVKPTTVFEGGRLVTRVEPRAKDEVDVNLIPEEFSAQLALNEQSKFRRGIAWMVGSVLLVALAYGGLMVFDIVTTNRTRAIEAEIVSLENQIQSLEQEKTNALLTQQHLNLVKNLLINHLYWTAFFGELEKHTVVDVYYSSFSMSGTDKVVLSAIGRDYQTVAQQLLAFEAADNFIKDVAIDAATADLDEQTGAYLQTRFNITLTFADGVFKKSLGN